jgi:stalled ribosome rescue protein Dom34
VDDNAETRASFGAEEIKDEYESALIYKLQKKKKHIESNDQSNVDSTFTDDISTSLQLLLIWRYDNVHKCSSRARLIKHSITITWDEDTLEKVHSIHLALLRSVPIIKDTWLLDDTTILMTASEWEDYSQTFEITISEGTKEDSAMGPLWVSSNM